MQCVFRIDFVSNATTILALFRRAPVYKVFSRRNDDYTPPLNGIERTEVDVSPENSSMIIVQRDVSLLIHTIHIRCLIVTFHSLLGFYILLLSGWEHHKMPLIIMLEINCTSWQHHGDQQGTSHHNIGLLRGLFAHFSSGVPYHIPADQSIV
jgi:hypothetical protein